MHGGKLALTTHKSVLLTILFDPVDSINPLNQNDNELEAHAYTHTHTQIEQKRNDCGEEVI